MTLQLMEQIKMKNVNDTVNQVNTKYFVDKYSNKLFFGSAITSRGSDLASNDISNIKNFCSLKEIDHLKLMVIQKHMK